MTAEDVLAAAGLCGTCAHVLVRPTRRGPTYLRCGLAASDPAYVKYPRLPVLACAGHTPTGDDRPGPR